MGFFYLSNVPYMLLVSINSPLKIHCLVKVRNSKELVANLHLYLLQKSCQLDKYHCVPFLLESIKDLQVPLRQFILNVWVPSCPLTPFGFGYFIIFSMTTLGYMVRLVKDCSKLYLLVMPFALTQKLNSMLSFDYHRMTMLKILFQPILPLDDFLLITHHSSCSHIL